MSAADNDQPVLPRLWRANDLKPALQPRWLARGRIPSGAVSLLVGDEGIGKSLLWVWLVAAITRGAALPEFGIPERDPGDVILGLTEDDWSSAVRPRLEVAGADLDRVQVVCAEVDGSGAPVFPRDLCLFNDLDVDPAMVVVDAWLDTVPAGLNVKDPQQARQALHPWKDVATRTGAAVLLLTHTNRVQSASARDKYGITSELRKKARLTLFAQQDEAGNLVVGPEKSNITGQIAASKFQIDPVQHFRATEDHDGTVPRLRHIGDSDRTARELIAESYESTHDLDADDRDAAVLWLEDYLTKHQPCPSAAAKADGAKALRVSDKTVARAAKKLGVVAESSGFPRTTVWHLPGFVVEDSQDSEDEQPPVSPQTVPTVPTGSDLHERSVPTAQWGQSGQLGQPGQHGEDLSPPSGSPIGRWAGSGESVTYSSPEDAA